MYGGSIDAGAVRSGFVASPNYPFPYSPAQYSSGGPQSAHVRWGFSVPTSMYLRFSVRHLDLETGETAVACSLDCHVDYLAVRFALETFIDYSEACLMIF